MTTTEAQEQQLDRGRAIFGRVLAGVDGSAEATEAARQAGILAEGPVTLLAVWDVASALVGGTGVGVPAYLDEEHQREGARRAVEEARGALAGADPGTKVARGTSWRELLREIEREGVSLVAVGSHGAGRARGIVAGSTATELVHKAPCSVVMSRKAGDDFPRRIVVGVDGSPESAAAYAAARHLTERFGVELWPVVAHGGKGVDRERVATIVDYRHEDSPDDPVKALVAAAAAADLLVLGSRGLHGLKSLGSVSERVAHGASCSVLIVRQPSASR